MLEFEKRTLTRFAPVMAGARYTQFLKLSQVMKTAVIIVQSNEKHPRTVQRMISKGGLEARALHAETNNRTE